jgi:hypothetical protein
MAQPLCRRLLMSTAVLGTALRLCAQQSALPPSGQPSLEYQVKAAFLLNFTRFIEWPAAEPPAAGAPFTICILGDDPFGVALDQTMEGESANGRKIVIQRSRREVGKTCQILYVDRAEKGITELLTGVGRGVLTVGEGESFLREGGMIAFVVENRRVRFNVNLAAARNASLNISSKLLNVAKVVER